MTALTGRTYDRTVLAMNRLKALPRVVSDYGEDHRPLDGRDQRRRQAASRGGSATLPSSTCASRRQ